jgi:hypothetical protein
MAYRGDKDIVHYISGTIEPSVHVEGIEDVVEAFTDLPKYMQLAGMHRALTAAGNVLMAAIEPRIPIRLEISDGELRVAGGQLKDAMKSEVTLDSNYRGGMIEIHFGKLGFIANFVEYGHVMLSHAGKTLTGPKTPGGFVKAYPFIRPAVDGCWEQAIDVFTDSMDLTVRQWAMKWGGVELAV